MDASGILDVFRSMPIDWLIVVIVMLVSAIDSAWAGASRSIAFALGFPLALFLYAAAAQAFLLSSALDQVTTPIAQAIAFGCILAASWFATYRLFSVFDAPLSFPMAFLTGISLAVITVVYLLATAPLQSLVHLSPSIHMVFGDVYRFWWLVLSYFALAFVRS